MLQKAGYDKVKTQFLVNGFRDGVSLGYCRQDKVKITSNNLKFVIGDEIDLWNKIMKEVKLKRYAGPYKDIPYEDDFIQSPLGLVPKDNGTDMRLIFHLSHPRKVGQDGQRNSVNANTPSEICKVNYPDFSTVVLCCMQEGQNCSIGRSDNRSAFRNLGILPRHWWYLIMKAKSPIDHCWYFFVDKCHPFGASISCSHFQKVSDAVAFLVQHSTNKPLVNYLDDYLFAALLVAI